MIDRNLIKKSFCTRPWIAGSVTCGGEVFICCRINTLPFSKLRKEDGTKYNAEFDLAPRNNEYQKILRADLIAGIRNNICRRCWEIEDAGIISHRMACNDYFFPDEMDRAIELTKEDGTIDPKDFPIKHYDLRFGNKCNSKCIMCGAGNSTMWGPPIDWSNESLDSPYMKEFLSSMEYIERIALTGGEPTINKTQWLMIDKLIEHDHSKHIVLNYNSNGVLMKKEFLDKWAKFEYVCVGFSIDGTGEIFEEIRYPSKWKTIKENLRKFDKYAGPSTFGFMAITVSNINILNILDLFKWHYAEKFKNIPVDGHLNNILFLPKRFDIRRIPYEQKLKIKEEYKKFYEWVDENCDLEESVKDHIKANHDGIISIMFNHAPDKKELEGVKEYIRKIDSEIGDYDGTFKT